MHGVPCVAFDCPYGPRNIIEDGKCGFLIEEGNNQLFIEKLSHLIEDEPLRQQFSQAALQQAKCFDADKIMKKWKDLFEEIIAE
jgi:glycosyltransferase involved in cell wall biosynthesis